MVVEVEQADERQARAPDELLANATQRGEEHHALVDGHLVDERIELGAIAELTLEELQVALDAHRVEVGVAAADQLVAGDHLERARLAGAVDAEQAEALGASQSEAHAAHRHEVGIGLGQTIHHEYLVVAVAELLRIDPRIKRQIARDLIDAHLFGNHVRVLRDVAVLLVLKNAAVHTQYVRGSVAVIVQAAAAAAVGLSVCVGGRRVRRLDDVHVARSALVVEREPGELTSHNVAQLDEHAGLVEQEECEGDGELSEQEGDVAEQTRLLPVVVVVRVAEGARARRAALRRVGDRHVELVGERLADVLDLGVLVHVDDGLAAHKLKKKI